MNNGGKTDVVAAFIGCSVQNAYTAEKPQHTTWFHDQIVSRSADLMAKDGLSVYIPSDPPAVSHADVIF